MKKNKLFLVCTILGLSAAAAGCQFSWSVQSGQTERSGRTEQSGQAAHSGQTDSMSLYDRGLKLISLIDETMENEEVLQLYSTNPDFNAIVTQAGEGDFSSPSAVYSLTFTDTGIAEFLSANSTTLPDNISDELRDNILSRLYLTITNQINAYAGSEALTAASICTLTDGFVNTELSEPVIYIYTFNDAVPMAVTFVPKEDGAVFSNACPIFNDSFQADSQEELEAFFNDLSMDVNIQRVRP